MSEKPEFDRFAKDYDEVLDQAIPDGLNEDGYFAEYKVRMLAERLTEGTGQGGAGLRILDFGCGAGRSLPHLQQRLQGAEIWGYDVSPDSLRVAAERVPGAHLAADWASLANVRFDAILAANVFHHIPPGEQVEWMRRCREALAPRGELFLFEHNPFNPLTRWVFERCPFDVDAKMIRMKQVLAMAEDAGLRSSGLGYTLFFPRPLAALRRLEPLLRWLPLGAQYYVQLAK